MKRLVQSALLLISGWILLSSPEISRQAVQAGLAVCCRTILPALFPFLILTKLWIGLQLDQPLQAVLQPVMERIFHNPGAASAWVLGSVGGYPVGAQIIAQLYDEKVLSRDEACHALLFCCNAGPAFVIAVIGSGLFQNLWIGAILFMIHLLASGVVGIIFRPPKNTSRKKSNIRKAGINPSLLFAQSVSSASETALQICAYVLVFSILQLHLQQILPNNLITMLFLCALELAHGTAILEEMSLSPLLTFLISAALLGWGGLCIYGQTHSILSKSKLPGKPYLLGKLFHSAISLLLAWIIFPFLPFKTPCIAPSATNSVPYWSFILLFLPLVKSFSGKRSDYPL